MRLLGSHFRCTIFLSNVTNSEINVLSLVSGNIVVLSIKHAPVFHFPGRQNYRLYVIYKIPTIKVLDFQKVKQSERERARRLASSAAGAAMESDARLEALAAAATAPSPSMDQDGALVGGAYASAGNGENGTNTFEPGEGKSAEESFATQFTVEEKAIIRDMVANASSAEEIDRIESMVKRGIFPGSTQGSSPMQQPPLPENGKRSAEGEGEESESKKQRFE